jgi:hypothetical protein
MPGETDPSGVGWHLGDALWFGTIAAGIGEMMVGVSVDSGPVVGAAFFQLVGAAGIGFVRLAVMNRGEGE